MTKGICFLFAAYLVFIPPGLGFEDTGDEEQRWAGRTDNQILAVPIVYYTPETRIAGGVGGIYYLHSLKDQFRKYPSTFSMSAIYTQENQFQMEINPNLYLGKGKLQLVGHLGFKNYVESFYGMGSQTTDDMREKYGYRNITVKCSLRNRVLPGFYVGIQYDFENFRITETQKGGILETSRIDGDQNGTISGLGVLLLQDNRDNKFFPRKGSLLKADLMVFSHALASDFPYHKFAFDSRQYITVFSNHVLAFQQNIQITEGEVPFRRLPKLGGPNIMRGFIEGRFRDKKAIILQMEYRVPLIWRLSAAGFVGYGDVADKFNSFKLKDFKVAGGLGIRYKVNHSGTNLRMDFGFARGNFGVYAMINEAF
jgi:outer membrane protein assembly factor BamA